MANNNEHKCVSQDELLVQTKRNIGKYGLQVIMVSASNYSPSFAYSVGLFDTYEHPEVICIGLSDKLGHQIINDVAEYIKNGQKFQSYINYTNIFKDSRAEFLPVDERNLTDYFGAAINYYGHIAFPAIQLVWTDRNDKFPWEEGFEDEFLYDQPLLDRNSDFKFREAKNLAVFTTRQWLDLNKPVLRVVHDIDGDWQFLTGDQIAEDIRIVALEELITADSTLNEAFDLDYGYSMDRDSVGGEWIKKKLEDGPDDENTIS